MYGMATVIGEPTVARNPGLPTLELDLMRVKGRNRPSRIYTLSETLGADKENVDRLVPLQEAMLAAFRSKDWDRAEALIDECRQSGIASLETYYGIYSARIGDFRADPPPDDWDGAATADTK